MSLLMSPDGLICWLSKGRSYDFIYIYPLEVKATLNALHSENGFILNETKYSWYLKDIIPSEIVEYVKLGKVKILINIIHDPLYDYNSLREFEEVIRKWILVGLNSIQLNNQDIVIVKRWNYDIILRLRI